MTEWKPGDQPRRVDPPSCGCTDCLIGYSVPLTWATNARSEVLRITGEVKGLIDQAKGLLHTADEEVPGD